MKQSQLAKSLMTAALVSISLLTACNQEKVKETKKDQALPSEKLQSLVQTVKSTFGVLPDQMPGSENDTPERIALGKKLYFETALSINGQQSCNSCHDITGNKGGVDNLPTSPGALGKKGGRNSPTTLNAGFHMAQFWDGRAKDLQEQAKGPILNPIEMGMKSTKDVEQVLAKMPEYPKLFAQAFPKDKNSLNYENLGEAIAAFERTLITHDRFEDFAQGDNQALTPLELKGLETFLASGCTACHNGATFGGQTYMKLGLVNAYPDSSDLGRFEVTGNEADKMVFKVPSLKNIALTAPYFHNGQVATLEEAIQLMGYHQAGKELNNKEIDAIVAFLNTLTDKTRL